jgi:hypothetical protein
VRAAKPRASEDILLSDRERTGAFWLFAETVTAHHGERAGAFWLCAVAEARSTSQRSWNFWLFAVNTLSEPISTLYSRMAISMSKSSESQVSKPIFW